MAEAPHGPTIFISYAREDVDRIWPIAEGLETLGWQVWWDFPTLSPALLFTNESLAALGDTKWIVFMWSQSSVEPEWSAQELLDVLKHRRVVSVTLDDDLNVPQPFNQLEQHNLSNWSGNVSAPKFQKFVSAFTILLGSSEDSADLDAFGKSEGLEPGISSVQMDIQESPTLSLPLDEVLKDLDLPSPADPSDTASEPIDLPESLKQTLHLRDLSYRRKPAPQVAKQNSTMSKPLPSDWSAHHREDSFDQDRTIFTSPRSSSEDWPESYDYASAPKSSLGTRIFKYIVIAGGIALAGWLGLKLVPLIFGTTSSAKSRKSDQPPIKTNPVDCSVFAPPKLAVDDEILVQVYLHPPELAEEAKAGAKQFDTDAEWRGFTSLSLDLASGTRVGIQLEVADLTVSDGGIGEIRWNNRVTGISFLVSAPKGASPGKRHGTVRLMVDGIPAGRIHFIIELKSSLEEKALPEPLGDTAHRYRKAFISYASEDRAEVLKRVQTLGALKIKYFQDVLDLDPGDRWEKELYKEIDECDLFMLFWSSASKESEWVYKETLYARRRQIESKSDEPDIIPMIIEGPPPPKPWPEFKHLHFNDKLIYVMRYHEDN